MSTATAAKVNKEQPTGVSWVWAIWVLPCVGVAGYAIVRYLIMPPSQGHFSQRLLLLQVHASGGAVGSTHWSLAILDLAPPYPPRVASLVRPHIPAGSSSFILGGVHLVFLFGRRVGHSLRIRIASGCLVVDRMDGLQYGTREAIPSPPRVDGP